MADLGLSGHTTRAQNFEPRGKFVNTWENFSNISTFFDPEIRQNLSYLYLACHTFYARCLAGVPGLPADCAAILINSVFCPGLLENTVSTIWWSNIVICAAPVPPSAVRRQLNKSQPGSQTSQLDPAPTRFHITSHGAAGQSAFR